MTTLVDRLKRVGTERQRTTAHDIPGHYLRVVAQISQADGKMMLEAAEELEYHKIAIQQLLDSFEHLAGDFEDDNEAEYALFAVEYAKDTLTGNENK